jgi:hypothetical protein
MKETSASVGASVREAWHWGSRLTPFHRDLPVALPSSAEANS